MTDPDANDLGPNSWVERFSHMVQDTPSYAAAAASPSRGTAGVDAELTSPNDAGAYDLESDPGFVRNARECLLLGGYTVTPITSCLRGR